MAFASGDAVLEHLDLVQLGRLTIPPATPRVPGWRAALLRDTAWALRLKNDPRGGCPRFSVSRLPRPPSSAIFSSFSKPSSCPALPIVLNKGKREDTSGSRRQRQATDTITMGCGAPAAAWKRAAGPRPDGHHQAGGKTVTGHGNFGHAARLGRDARGRVAPVSANFLQVTGT
jgi:hypothetical protein